MSEDKIGALERPHMAGQLQSWQTERMRLRLRVVAAPNLEVSTILRHGSIVEIEGSTDPGDIMINGEPGATFFDGNSFRHFVGPLPTGLTIITITAQDEHGGVTTRQLAITTE